MPADLAATDPSIIVHDRNGARLPYSRGIMATSLLATGVHTEEAYRLASLIQGRLLQNGCRDVDGSELLDLALVVMREEEGAGTGVSERWSAWRHAKRSGRPIVVVLGGAPGSGKSTLATRLAVRLDVTRVITTDAIREVLRVVVPEAVLPELHGSTFDVVGERGPMEFAAFDRQCSAVARATGAVASRLATEDRSMILEGVHLAPGAMTRQLSGHPADPIVVERLVMIDESRHTEHLRARTESEPLRGGHRYLDRFRELRSIQTHLIEQAHAEGIRIVGSHEATELTQDIVDEIAVRATAATRSAVGA